MTKEMIEQMEHNIARNYFKCELKNVVDKSFEKYYNDNVNNLTTKQKITLRNTINDLKEVIDKL
jgi:hypothetical protein